MMKCDNCSHECTVVDFVTLRNLCEHLYLDSLARKNHPYWFSSTLPACSGRDFKGLVPRTLDPEERVELLPLGPCSR